MIAPNTRPTIGPKYQPITINGNQAREIDKENGAILIVNSPSTILNAIKIARKNINCKVRKDLIGEKGKKNFFTLKYESFFSPLSIICYSLILSNEDLSFFSSGFSTFTGFCISTPEAGGTLFDSALKESIYPFIFASIFSVSVFGL
ncbi:MAG: hypothetical protein MJ223_03040 [Mycoplasmoidaceae bacterium]|nr:hypothetical protein [Mycoplasmoidaceae bacterium]